MSLTSLLRDPQSPVRAYLDRVSPLLEASSGTSDNSRAAAEALGLFEIMRRQTVVSAFPGTDLPLSGTALDFRTRIELGGFDPLRSMAAAGVAQLTRCVPFMENGLHRARILTEAFSMAQVLLDEPSGETDLDRASILLAHCEQVARVGAKAINGAVGASCDKAIDGESFAYQLDPLALANISSLMFQNADQLQEWQEQIDGGKRYEPNPRFTGADLVEGADADWMIGDTLVDCKVYGTLTVPKLRDFMRQLLGYVMLDSDDTLGIRHVSLWLPRQMTTPRWSLTRLLGGDPEELLPALRQGFIKATGKTQLAPHIPISLRRKRQLLAENRHTPYEMLVDLALSEDADIRRRVGRNVVTPQVTVRMLAEDARWQVRQGVAMNELAPDDVLDTLRRDRSSVVRLAAAANPGAPLPLAEALEVDADHDLQSLTPIDDSFADVLVGTALPMAGWSAAAGDSGLQISQNRDDLAFDSTWFCDFLKAIHGYPRLPIPNASYRWASQLNRSLAVEDWMRAGLSDEVLADLMREDRPGWLRRIISGYVPISDPAMRERLLSDTDPDIRWNILKRTLHSHDQLLSARLADLAASPETLTRFRTEGMGPKNEWRHTAAHYQHETLRLIASHPATPQSTLKTLMVSSSVELLADLIENPALECDDRASLLLTLQTSKSVLARETLASLQSVPDTVLNDLVSDRDVRVRTAVSKHHATPHAALSRLAADHKRTVRLAVLQNPATPAELARSLAEAMLLVDDDEDLYAVLRLTETRANLDVPPQIIEAALDRLSKSRLRDPDMRVAVADDERSSHKALSRLARSTNNDVRHAVATNPCTPVTVLNKLAKDPEPTVRAMVARHQLCPTMVLEELAHDDDPLVRAWAAKNPNLPRDILESLLTDAESNVRAAALKNPMTPLDIVRKTKTELVLRTQPLRRSRADLEELAANNCAEVRMEAAFDPAADADLLILLGGERRSAQVRRAVAANPNTPAAVLRSLANDKDNQVRQALAFNGATPEPLLVELAGRSIDLAVLVAMNPDAPSGILDALAQDSDPFIRFAAAGSRQARALSSNATTPQALEECYKSSEPKTG